MLADPPPEGVLAEMVAWEGNWALPDPSDAGAHAFLHEVTTIMRDVLEHANPQYGGWTDPKPTPPKAASS